MQKYMPADPEITDRAKQAFKVLLHDKIKKFAQDLILYFNLQTYKL